MCLQVDTRVNLSAQQENEKEKVMSDTYGLTSGKPLAYWNRDLSSWRMFEDTLLSDSLPFSGKLPTWGTMRDGVLYEQATLGHRTRERDCSLLPTPRAQNGESRNQNIWLWENGPQNLENAIALLPTPTASRSDTDNQEDWVQKSSELIDNGMPAKTYSLGLAVRTMKTKKEMTDLALTHQQLNDGN
jgi:hypothetical protein